MIANSSVTRLPEIGSVNAAVCFDSVDGTILKIGKNVDSIVHFANRTRAMYATNPLSAEIGTQIKVIVGPFTNDEYEQILDCTGYILRSPTLTDPRFQIN